MSKGLLQEIFDGITSPTSAPPMKLVFWTTSEARDPCLRIFPKSVASMQNAEHTAYSASDPTTHKLKSQSETRNASTGKTRISRSNSSFPSVYSQHPRPPTPFLSVRYPTKVPKSNFGFSRAQISADIPQEVNPHPRAQPEDLVDTSADDSTSSSAAMDRRRAEF